MKTSCFKCYKGNNGISIARRSPITYNGPEYFLLQPDSKTFYDIKNGIIDEVEYEKRFRNNTLSKLNPQEVYETLKDKVLLCWEPAGEFCHRRIVASWFKEELGIEVPEWKASDEKIKNTKELF
jgi:hypothetical protein